MKGGEKAMKLLIPLLLLAFLASACATDRNLTKQDLAELRKSLGSGQTLFYTKITANVEVFEIRKNKEVRKKKLKKPEKNLPIYKMISAMVSEYEQEGGEIR
jgi:outer membrane lipoprotein-sorting protein